MTGDEIITISIEHPKLNVRVSQRYTVMQADATTLTKGEYHLLVLDDVARLYDEGLKKKLAERDKSQ